MSKNNDPRLRYHPAVVEEAIKKAEPLALQMGLCVVPDEMLDLICPNLDFALEFSPELYAKFVSSQKVLI